MSDLEVVDVVRCLDGERRILVERDGSVLVYSLFEPAEVGSFGLLREIEGRMMGRADTRRREEPGEFDYDAALQWLLDQRRRAEAQIFVHCRELRDMGGRRVGVFRACGLVRFIGRVRAA